MENTGATRNWTTPHFAECENLNMILKEYWKWINCAFRMQVLFSFSGILFR